MNGRSEVEGVERLDVDCVAGAHGRAPGTRAGPGCPNSMMVPSRSGGFAMTATPRPRILRVLQVNEINVTEGTRCCQSNVVHQRGRGLPVGSGSGARCGRCQVKCAFGDERGRGLTAGSRFRGTLRARILRALAISAAPDIPVSTAAASVPLNRDPAVSPR